MRLSRIAFLPISFLLFLSSLASAQNPPNANDLLNQMTLEEKIAQLTQLPGFPIPEFTQQVGQKPEEVIAKYGAGSVLWVSEPKEINRWQHLAVDKSRLHIPALFGLDVIQGYHTIFPAPIAMASSWDLKLVEDSQTVAAREARAAGIAWAFGPMVDIARDARWGRMVEGAGEDPYLGAAMARAQVHGFQGSEIGAPDHVMVSVKHFAGYGAADGGRDYDSSYIPEELMWNLYLPPFKAAADAGAGTFMSAYMDLNDVPATGNHWLLHDDGQDAAYKAFHAGVDMDMASGTYFKFLPAEVKSGHLSMEEIDNSVRTILQMKIRLGLFEHPYVDEAYLAKVLNDPERLSKARTAVQRSVILLRNENSLLPLNKSGSKYKSIAVIGPLGDADIDMLGMWGSITNPGPSVSVVQGIKNKVGGAVQVEFAHGPNISRDIPSFFEGVPIIIMKEQPRQTPDEARRAFDEAVATAKKCDITVVVMGEIALMSGEAASRSSLKLSGGQEELLEAISATGRPVVLVLINGRPLEINWASEHVPAILEAWYPGNEGGNGIADILFGDADPAGHLPVSWPRSSGQLPLYYNHNLTQMPEDAPDFTSRYWDIKTSPLYPFGYGLSYTKFTFDNLKISKAEAKVGSDIQVSVDVSNMGSREGDAVVQLYIHQRAGSASRPARQLKGFQRVNLAVGAKQTVHFTLGKDELQFWSPATKGWVVEPEAFDVWVGGDSTAKLHGEFKLTPM
jgi:beta-glucosidase